MYKNKRHKVYNLFLFWSLLVLLSACAKDKLIVEKGDCVEEVTYIQDTRSIIEESCAYADCHDGSGAAPGNYRNYTGMSPTLFSGKFETRAITTRDMPPNYATGPKSLSQEQLQAFICWKENDFKE